MASLAPGHPNLQLDPTKSQPLTAVLMAAAESVGYSHSLPLTTQAPGHAHSLSLSS